MDISSLSDKEVIELYPAILGELKKRGIIRTNNLIGELGEYFVADIYKRTPSLPQLQLNLLPEMRQEYLQVFQMKTMG